MGFRRTPLLVLTSSGVLLTISGRGAAAAPPSGSEAMINLTSTAFGPRETIAEAHTYVGDDSSPPLFWGNPPAGTESFALVLCDPDAPLGTWVHGVLFNIPAQDRLPDGSLHGVNSWRRRGCGGLCPPSGSNHRYVCRVCAPDTELSLEAPATKKHLPEAAEGHVLA